MESTAQEASEEAVHKTRNAQQAIEIARQVQLDESISRGLEIFFKRGVDERKFIDVTRIPFICDDLGGIHTMLNEMRSDMRWMKYIGGGFVTAAGLLALKSLGV